MRCSPALCGRRRQQTRRRTIAVTFHACGRTDAGERAWRLPVAGTAPRLLANRNGGSLFNSGSRSSGRDYIPYAISRNPLAGRRERSYDFAAVPDSLLNRAYNATSFLSLPKAIGAIGLSGLTLLWNYKFGMRNWDTTKTFLLCLPLGYSSLALIALVWNLSVLGAKDRWAAFVGGMREEILGAVKDAATQAAPVQNQRPAPIEEWNLKRLRTFLTDKPQGSVKIVAEDGSPGAYTSSLRVAHVFEEFDWTVTKGFVGFGFTAESVFILDHEREVSKYCSLIGEALVASGITFQRQQMSSTEFVTCTIYITAQRPPIPA